MMMPTVGTGPGLSLRTSSSTWPPVALVNPTTKFLTTTYNVTILPMHRFLTYIHDSCVRHNTLELVLDSHFKLGETTSTMDPLKRKAHTEGYDSATLSGATRRVGRPTTRGVTFDTRDRTTWHGTPSSQSVVVIMTPPHRVRQRSLWSVCLSCDGRGLGEWEVVVDFG